MNQQDLERLRHTDLPFFRSSNLTACCSASSPNEQSSQGKATRHTTVVLTLISIRHLRTRLRVRRQPALVTAAKALEEDHTHQTTSLHQRPAPRRRSFAKLQRLCLHPTNPSSSHRSKGIGQDLLICCAKA